MKNALIASISAMLLGAIVWALLNSPKASHYPFTSVSGSISAFASASGYPIMERRTISEMVRGYQHPTMDGLYKQIAGKPLYNDIDESLYQGNIDSVRVKIYHSLGHVVSVEIRPSTSPSKLAQALQTDLTTSYPGLDCHVIRP